MNHKELRSRNTWQRKQDNYDQTIDSNTRIARRAELNTVLGQLLKAIQGIDTEVGWNWGTSPLDLDTWYKLRSDLLPEFITKTKWCIPKLMQQRLLTLLESEERAEWLVAFAVIRCYIIKAR